MESFTPVSALVGGALIGLGAALLLLLNGRIAGVSGILDGLLPPGQGDANWRVAFLIGLPVGAFLYFQVAGGALFVIEATVPILLVGGVITGLGVRWGSGCTSGHGVCGLGRLSGRSLVATMTFMVTTFVTVYVVRHAIG